MTGKDRIRWATSLWVSSRKFESLKLLLMIAALESNAAGR